VRRNQSNIVFADLELGEIEVIQLVSILQDAALDLGAIDPSHKVFKVSVSY
jgi:hypothetical protein